MQQSNDTTREILNLEKKYWQAMQDSDLNTAIELTNFPCIVVSARGVQSVSKDQFEKMFNSNQGALKTVNFDESKFEAQLVGPDTVVAAYEVSSSAEKDGKASNMQAVDSSTWIRKGDKWVCAMHTEIEKTKLQ